jgi:hypothetical protein
VKHLVTAAVAAVLLLTSGRTGGGQSIPSASDVHALLRSEGQFTDADLVALERNQPVARVLRDSQRRELTAVGAVRVHAPRPVLLDRIRNIVEFKQNAMVVQIGRFSTPPRLSDLNALTLERDDIEALRRCRPDDCTLRLPADEMQRIREGVDWRTPGAAAAATNLMREFLLRRAVRYLEGGSASLADYADKKPPIVAAAELDRLLAEPILLRRVPELVHYLRRFPLDAPPATDHFLYWSKERFGFKPVISVTHVTIYEPRQASPIAAYVTSKQIYASHYFDAALAVTGIVDTTAPGGGPAIYMIYVTRSRTPMLEGFFASLARGTVRGRTRDGLIETLRATKDRLEHPPR